MIIKSNKAKYKDDEDSDRHRDNNKTKDSIIISWPLYPVDEPQLKTICISCITCHLFG